MVAHRPGSRADALSFSGEHHPDQPSHASTYFQGGATAGDHLRTAAGAPPNAATFSRGFTVEVFAKLPADWGAASAWSSLLSREGTSGEAGKTHGYSTTEPVALLSLSGAAEAQWQVHPLDLDTSVTSWSHLLPLDTWWHLAITNDARYSTLHVDGCVVVRNPATVAHGIATLNRSWLLGGTEDADKVDQIHDGWIGDVRIVDRALSVDQFMIA